MPVISSTHELGNLLRGGRRYVTETHVLNAGAPVVIRYIAPPDANYVAIRQSRVPQINEQLAIEEFVQVLNDGT